MSISVSHLSVRQCISCQISRIKFTLVKNNKQLRHYSINWTIALNLKIIFSLFRLYMVKTGNLDDDDKLVWFWWYPVQIYSSRNTSKPPRTCSGQCLCLVCGPSRIRTMDSAWHQVGWTTLHLNTSLTSWPGLGLDYIYFITYSSTVQRLTVRQVDGEKRRTGIRRHTSILSLWQIPDSQRRSNISISSAREKMEGKTRRSKRGYAEKMK